MAYKIGDALLLAVTVVADRDLGHICLKAGDEQFLLEARTLDAVAQPAPARQSDVPPPPAEMLQGPEDASLQGRAKWWKR